MLTFPVAFRTQTLWGLLQHYTLLQVVSPNYMYCYVFVNSYNFLCEIHMEGSPVKHAQKKTIFVM